MILRLAFLVALLAQMAAAASTTNRVAELTFTSTKGYSDPFNDVSLDVEFTAPDGSTRVVPGFWSGGERWGARYASPTPGLHRWRSICSDSANRSLDGVSGSIEITAYVGANPLYAHGPLGISANKRFFQHADGTPFFWLADTWWMGLTGRLPFEGFEQLTRDRVGKGFTVVQIVAGLYPDMPPFDPRGANEAGFPWTRDYSSINPEYFNAADRRIAHLVENGLAPCIVGAWGYHLPHLGVEKMKRHWRYLVARYGAYPVFWCIAGEAAMPYYLSASRDRDITFQREGWTEVARYVRLVDPFKRPVTIHPTDMSRTQVTDPGVLDFEMLQTGHSDLASVPGTIQLLRASRAARPTMPTINSEVCYEGILNTCPAEVVRMMTWTSLLSGTAGHTYGANGIWQVNTKERPYGASPHGGNWGNTPWDEAMQLPGSAQSALAWRILRGLEHHRLEPHPEWASYADSLSPSPTWGHWIWSAADADPATDAPAAKRYFRKSFKLPEGHVDATLHLSVDDRYTAYLNEMKVASHSDWRTPHSIDISSSLRTGRNILAIEAENLPAPHPQNPAGLLASLQVKLSDGKTVQIPSDTTWKSSPEGPADWTSATFDDSSWPAAQSLGAYPRAPWNEFAPAQLLPLAAAGIPGKIRVIYVPNSTAIQLHDLEPGVGYSARSVDPTTGKEHRLSAVSAKAPRTIAKPATESQDWVLILESGNSGREPVESGP